MENEAKNLFRFRFRDKKCADLINTHIRYFLYSSIVLFIIVVSNHCVSADPQQDKGISKQLLENWASKFGNPLFEFGRSVTKYTELQNRFQNSVNGDVRKIELDKIINDMGQEIHTALKEKVEAIKKIMWWAEEKAFEYYSKTEDSRPKAPTTYYNAKKLNKDDGEEGGPEHHLDLKFDHHFGANVNTMHSSIHVPTFIFDKKQDVLDSIGWSEKMDETFRSNYEQNPTLFWQYFGSATGFLRQYPAVKWPNENVNKHIPDLYDCRMRPWYISAANSPKNMVILHDTSGSMTGIRREIAKHVVNTILDTLTENDYVNVFNFSEDTKPVVPCFKDKLVQANLENLREFRVGLDQDQTANISNFTSALNLAFDILEKHLNDNESSQCNQAIMIVSDGAPYNYEEIFKARQNPMHHVRVFTYLIGREVTDKREIMWMACANKGFYVHVATLSEVQEKVLRYMPVMSRPMVMHQKHDVTWTPVYADITTRGDNQPLLVKEDGMRFMISASVPVFDQRNSTKRVEILKNKTGTFEQTIEERIAIFLGVAGTDVPIKELKRIVSPFKLGVNGYSFVVTNNGYIVFHPDWRPMLNNEVLKPHYNTVDLTEVELIDSEENFRNNDSSLLEMRQDMIDQDKGYKTLKVRIHQDKFRRVTTRKQRYEYMKIGQTPYTLGISVPANLHRFHGELELRRDLQGMDVTTYFDKPESEDNIKSSTRDWKINPKWNYCEYIRGGQVYYQPFTNQKPSSGTGKATSTKEDLLLHFLKEIQRARNSWAWRNTGVGINRPRHSAGNSNKDKFLESDVYVCDRDLVQSLVFDANVTDVFTSKKLWKFNKNDSEFIKLYGIIMSFIATRSGLTRWIQFDPVTFRPAAATHNRFIEENSRATEELWYKRAVERYEFDPDSFVFSVPFDAGTRNDTTVTATRAIYVKKNNRHAPVAVAGIQLNHTIWVEKFFEVTSTCSERGDTSCKKTCDSGEFDCFVLDDNGFILISEKHEDTGKFFGEIDGMVMEMLVNSDVYRRVRVVDYQAVCTSPTAKSSFASFLSTPLDHMRRLFSWFVAHLAWLALQLNFHSIINPDLSSVFANVIANKDESSANDDTVVPVDMSVMNRSRLRPCDKEYLLYTYGSSYNTHNFSYHGLLTKCGHSGCDGYFNVHYIPHTNLILVVTDGKCRCGLNSTTIKPKEMNYPLDDEFENSTAESDVLTQLCRIPYIPLYRQRPTQCQSYNSEEDYIREDCGAGSTLIPEVALLTLLLILLHLHQQ